MVQGNFHMPLDRVLDVVVINPQLPPAEVRVSNSLIWTWVRGSECIDVSHPVKVARWKSKIRCGSTINDTVALQDVENTGGTDGHARKITAGEGWALSHPAKERVSALQSLRVSCAGGTDGIKPPVGGKWNGEGQRYGNDHGAVHY